MSQSNGGMTLSVHAEDNLAKMKNNIYEVQGAAALGELYVFGGFVNGFRMMTKDTNVYDPAADTWSQVAPMPASHDGITHTANAVDERQRGIYNIGGLANRPGWPKGSYAVKTTWAYDTKTDTWSQLPDLPEARDSGQSVPAVKPTATTLQKRSPAYTAARTSIKTLFVCQHADCLADGPTCLHPQCVLKHEDAMHAC